MESMAECSAGLAEPPAGVRLREPEAEAADRMAHLPSPTPEDDDEDEDEDKDRGSDGGNIDPDEDEGWSDEDDDDEDEPLRTQARCFTNRAALSVRLRERIRDRGGARRAAAGAELAAARRLRSLRRAALGHGVHRAARREPALLALPHAPARRCTARFGRIDDAPAAQRAVRRGRDRRRTGCAGTRCRCPTTPADFVDGLVTIGRQRRRRARRPGSASTSTARNRSMRERVFYDADGELLIVPQQGALRARAPSSACWTRARRDRASSRAACSFRVELPDGARARLCLRELRRAVPPARARADRRQRPRQPARLPGARSPRSRTVDGPTRAGREVRRAAVDARRSTIRRSTSSPGTAIYAPYKYDLARFNTIEHGQLRPPRSVDLHRADLAVARRPAPPTATS